MDARAILALIALFLSGVGIGMAITNLVFTIELPKKRDNGSNSGNGGKSESDDN